MRSVRRRSVQCYALLTTMLAGCGASRAPRAPTWCAPEAPPGMPAFTTARVEHLAGTYQMVFFGDNETLHGFRDGGRLTLWVQDSVRRRRGLFRPLPPGRERVLGAAYEPTPRDTTAAGRALASRDLDHPGGVYEQGRLLLGAYDAFDGTGDYLAIEHAGADGFRGRWVSELGIGVLVDRATGRTLPNPAGYFCARRVGSRGLRAGT